MNSDQGRDDGFFFQSIICSSNFRFDYVEIMIVKLGLLCKNSELEDFFFFFLAFNPKWNYYKPMIRGLGHCLSGLTLQPALYVVALIVPGLLALN